ncbi:MAG: tyrosinase family protein [Rhodospirillales bacterium]|nr:tyrosinase family protein [Rhodospirillales bacterium]
MRRRPFQDPTSWAFQGAVHGYSQNRAPWPSLVSPPRPNFPDWERCQHQTWFFLPWHRGYLAAFEAIVASIVEALGGPGEWALPYWNYSDGSANARRMPRGFTGRRRPDGSNNPLWSPRRPNFDNDFNYQIPAGIVDTGPALSTPRFTSGRTGVPPGFGGPETGSVHFGAASGFANGELESQPHNLVHDAIGGLMGDPNTAGLDPIFWLHHANVDRLWQVWVEQPAAAGNPNTPMWLNNVAFSLYDASGMQWTFTSSDVLDTRTVLHGYEYDDQAPAAPAAIALEAIETAMAAEGSGEPELIGASTTGISLVSGSARTTVRIDAATLGARDLLESVGPPPRTYLNIENVTGLGVGTIYRVLVRSPGGEPVHTGYLSAFGSFGRGDLGDQAGGGNSAFDVTEALARAGNVAAESPQVDLEVLFEQELPPTEEEAPEAASLEAIEPAREPRIGRVSLYQTR